MNDLCSAIQIQSSVREILLLCICILTCYLVNSSINHEGIRNYKALFLGAALHSLFLLLFLVTVTVCNTVQDQSTLHTEHHACQWCAIPQAQNNGILLKKRCVLGTGVSDADINDASLFDGARCILNKLLCNFSLDNCVDGSVLNCRNQRKEKRNHFVDQHSLTRKAHLRL